MLDRTVTEAAERWGDRTAYVAPNGWSLSYRELDRLSDEAAVGLARGGVGLGDVVSLVLPAMPEYLIAYAATAKLGAITAGVNARLASGEREAVVESVSPDLVISTPDLDPGADVETLVIEPAASARDALAQIRVRHEAPPVLPDDPDRPVAIVFTSGTTGLPKGALFGARQLRFIARVDTGFRWGPGGRTLSGTSLAHLGPMTKFPGNLIRGSTTHLLGRWRASDALRLVELHRMAGFGGIPTQVALMLREPDFDRRDLSAVRALVIGGGPATPSLVREARERFDAAVAIRYSCTEAGIGVGTALDDPPEDAEVSVGRAHHGVDLTIVDTDLLPVPSGEVGEVCLRSPAVMSGYWGNRSATRGAFTSDGAVRTGDLGFIDDEGRLRLAGRAREMYIRGGYNVYPQQVEGALADHPAIADIAISPRDDDVMGEVGVAVVVPAKAAAPPTLQDLRDFAGPELARHELPEHLVVVEQLPLTPMDKLDRRALEDMAAD